LTIGHAASSHFRVSIVRISNSTRMWGKRKCIEQEGPQDAPHRLLRQRLARRTARQRCRLRCRMPEGSGLCNEHGFVLIEARSLSDLADAPEAIPDMRQASHLAL
jgi:hypothetical protein